MNGIYTVLLLVLSNVFMTLAWYGHLKLQQTGTASNWPLIGVIGFSWLIAFFEYCCQVPANRIGFEGNGGPFSLVQLKVIQECISLPSRNTAASASASSASSPLSILSSWKDKGRNSSQQKRGEISVFLFFHKKIAKLALLLKRNV